MTDVWGDSAAKRRCFKVREQRQNAAHRVSYKRFRRRIIRRGSGEAPVASTPVAAGWRCGSGFESDPVCQRLELDSPPRHVGTTHSALQGNLEETALAAGASHRGAVTPLKTLRSHSAEGKPDSENDPKPGWVWRAGAQAGSDERTGHLPFDLLDEAPVGVQGKLVRRLAAPSLLDDYYTNLLDCSCSGITALALGPCVYLWDSEASTLVASLGPTPPAGPHSVSSLRWSPDGRLLCVGTRRGEIQLWDVEQKRRVRCLPSHLSVVTALSWKQQLLSSGSALGHILHLDVRAPPAPVGAGVQEEGVCSLQWSPGGERLASGSPDGLLSIWDGDVAGPRSHQPVCSMRQPSAVKAVGWCPWQRKLLATGGGWKDGALRVWDSQTGTCVTSVHTDSQICSLRWAERKEWLVTAHGLPHHQVALWDFPSLDTSHRLTGHCQRVLHVALNPDETQIFSAGADQRLHIWDL
ncbi:cell division cycle protein 20 homolog B-like isoform X2 [Betta splendens]|uniref:Cell division cycle protein 20 homolog B-like isoform X2 n=1 Tax=Betta splendens TaxID=158456 RepID=A0A6P7NI54_BETSP|nr:cell division cycle protein 20 homolog B-like isoform X2 [Betta splendens]